MSTGKSPSKNSLSCPYKGLIPYGEEDARIFFGREDWCTIIQDNLLASHLTLLYGPSGVGKSSVLQAGVVCKLKKQSKDKVKSGMAPGWGVIVCRDWRDNPLTTLRERILAEVQDLIGRPLDGQQENGGDLGTLLKACSRAISRTDVDGVNIPGKLLLILDQFEEYFLYHSQESGAGSFAEEFPRALNQSELSLNVLISLREDSLAKLDRFKTTIPNLFANRLQIDHLNRDAAIDAILKPIEEYNRQLPADSPKASVEPQLIQDVLEQVKVGQINDSEEASSDQPSIPLPGSAETLRVETPFLQLVMTRLWDEESRVDSPPRLRQQTLVRLGGAGPIVRDHLELLMSRLPGSSQKVAAVIFDKLVTSGLTKIAYPVFELTDPTKVEHPQDLVNRQELKELLDQLSSGSQRILRRLPPAMDQPNAEERYEIFHDVLAKPILEWRRAYREAAERETERHRHAEELEYERQRRHMLRNRNARIIGILGLIIAGLLLWILRLWAQEQKLKGIEAAQQFKAQQLDQIDALVQAMEAAHSLTWLGLVDRRDIAANLRHILDNINEISKVDLLTEGDDSARVIRFLPDGSGVGILFQNNQFELRDLKGKTLWHLPPADRVSFSENTDEAGILGFAFAKQDGKLATISGRGLLRVWDAQRKMTQQSSTSALDGIPPFLLRNRLHFSHDGKRLAFVDKQGVLRTLELNMPKPVVEAHRFGSDNESLIPPVQLVRFSPMGDVLATATEDGEILFFDPGSARRLPAPHSTIPSGRIFNMEFASKGQALATASPEGVRLWQKNLQGQWLLTVLRAGRTSQLRFSPDDRFLATGSLDGLTRLWAVRGDTDRQPLVSFLNQAPVQDVRFKPDGNLLTVSTAGTLHEWKVPVPPGPTLPPLRVSAVAFSSGGHWLARATLGERSVCLEQLKDGIEGTSLKGPTTAGRCSGIPLLLPSRTAPSGRAPATAMAQLAFSPSTTFVAGLSWRNGGLLWNQQGQLVRQFKLEGAGPTGVNGPFSAISFSPDGQRFAFVARGGEAGKLISCSIQSNMSRSKCAPISIVWPHFSSKLAKPSVTSVYFLSRVRSAVSNILLSTTDGQICSGSMATEQNSTTVVSLNCHKLGLRKGTWWQLSVSPNGSTIGLAGFDGTLHLFRRRSGDELQRSLAAPIKVSAGPLLDVSFSPRGGVLAAVSLDGTASLWDGKGRQLASFRGDAERGESFMKATFTADGSKVLLATTQGTIEEKKVEDLPMLLNRGCKALKAFLANPATDNQVRNRLSFCKS